MHLRRTLVLSLALTTSFNGCTNDSPTPAERTNFNKHIAPIVFKNCTPCHRPEESGPFSLLTYKDVKKRARQIVRVTESRFMPPWLPASTGERFLDEKRLEDREIKLIRRWVEDGAIEGNPEDLPAQPKFTHGWQLGPPDLILELPERYTLPAEGTDVFRNFVIPLPISRPRYVRAVELRPGNPQIIHHAVTGVDRSGVSRQEDSKDEEPGYPGMEMKGSQIIDGHYFTWTPGKEPFKGNEGMAAQLHPNSDVILQLHMLPNGKREPIRPKLGLFFTDEPPTIHPYVLILELEKIDIPAGKSDYMDTDTYKTLMDFEILAVYPHAHYLGKEVEAYALLPDGTKQWLVHIPEWDFNWQTDYQFRDRVTVPAGSTLTMRWTYDNSSGNVRNPNRPPKRVRHGDRSFDEMGQLFIRVLPTNEEDRRKMREQYLRHLQRQKR